MLCWHLQDAIIPFASINAGHGRVRDLPAVSRMRSDEGTKSRNPASAFVRSHPWSNMDSRSGGRRAGKNNFQAEAPSGGSNCATRPFVRGRGGRERDEGRDKREKGGGGRGEKERSMDKGGQRWRSHERGGESGDREIGDRERERNSNYDTTIPRGKEGNASTIDAPTNYADDSLKKNSVRSASEQDHARKDSEEGATGQEVLAMREARDGSDIIRKESSLQAQVLKSKARLQRTHFLGMKDPSDDELPPPPVKKEISQVRVRASSNDGSRHEGGVGEAYTGRVVKDAMDEESDKARRAAERRAQFVHHQQLGGLGTMPSSKAGSVRAPEEGDEKGDERWASASFDDPSASFCLEPCASPPVEKGSSVKHHLHVLRRLQQEDQLCLREGRERGSISHSTSPGDEISHSSSQNSRKSHAVAQGRLKYFPTRTGAEAEMGTSTLSPEKLKGTTSTASSAFRDKIAAEMRNASCDDAQGGASSGGGVASAAGGQMRDDWEQEERRSSGEGGNDRGGGQSFAENVTPASCAAVGEMRGGWGVGCLVWENSRTTAEPSAHAQRRRNAGLESKGRQDQELKQEHLGDGVADSVTQKINKRAEKSPHETSGVHEAASAASIVPESAAQAVSVFDGSKAIGQSGTSQAALGTRVATSPEVLHVSATWSTDVKAELLSSTEAAPSQVAGSGGGGDGGGGVHKVYGLSQGVQSALPQEDKLAGKGANEGREGEGGRGGFKNRDERERDIYEVHQLLYEVGMQSLRLASNIPIHTVSSSTPANAPGTRAAHSFEALPVFSRADSGDAASADKVESAVRFQDPEVECVLSYRMFSLYTSSSRPPPCLSHELYHLSHELILVQHSAPPARAPPPRPPFSRAQVVVTAPSAFAMQLSSPSISRHMASAAGDKSSPTNYTVPFPQTMASAAGVTGSPSSPNPTQTLSVPVSMTTRYPVCSAPPLGSALATYSTKGVTLASASTSAWSTPIAPHHPATLFSTPHPAKTTTPPLALPTQTQTVHNYAASVQTFPLRTTNLRSHSERALQEGSLGPGEQGPRMSGGGKAVPWSAQTRGPWDSAIMSQMIQHSPLVAYSPGPDKQAQRAVPTCTTKKQEASHSASTTPPGPPPKHFRASVHRLGEGERGREKFIDNQIDD